MRAASNCGYTACIIEKETHLDALRILVSDSDVARSQELVLQLTSAGYFVAGVVDVSEISEALDAKTPDILLLALNGETADSSELVQDVKKLVEELAVPVVVAIKGLDPTLSEQLAKCGIWGLVTDPLSADNLNSALWIAAYRSWEYWEAMNQMDKLKQDIETREASEKAKAIIMRHFSLPEHDAYLHLRSKCRNQQKTMEQVSRAIIVAEETLMKQIGG